MNALVLSAALAIAGTAGAASAPEATVGLSISLTPKGDNGAIQTVEVDQTIAGIAGRAGVALFEVPVRVTTVMGQVYRDGDVVAVDAEGALPLSIAEEAPVAGSPVQMRSFTPVRDTRGPLTLRYRADVKLATSPRKPGPSYDLRSANGGFGGAFFSFLLLPKNPPATYDFKLHWNLDQLPPGASGVTTRGVGDVSAQVAAEEVSTIFLLAGKMGSYAPKGSLFHAYWIGRPPFDPQPNAAWSAKSFAVLRTSFDEPEVRPFYLLMRPHQLPRDGGGATRGGFMLEYGVGAMADTARRFMFTHEMIHHFIGSLDGDSGAHAWFGEGLAEFYKVRLPLRAGLADLASTVNEIATMSNAYYTSPSIELTNAEVALRRWTQPSAQGVPYNRGFMYFADLNAKVRAATAGKHSLDELVKAMLASRRNGAGYSEAQWRELLRAELGQGGVDDLDRMLAGELIIPADDAFGVCLERRERSVARPVLGFDENALLVSPHVVTNLAADSAAAKAGLRNDDEIVSFTGALPRIAHSASNVVLDPTMSLEVRRSGRVERVTFSTEGARVPEYYWQQRSGVMRASCAF